MRTTITLNFDWWVVLSRNSCFKVKKHVISPRPPGS